MTVLAQYQYSTTNQTKYEQLLNVEVKHFNLQIMLNKSRKKVKQKR